MAKVNVILCDSCKERVATKDCKCFLCGKDLCVSCYREIAFYYSVASDCMFSLILCKDCYVENRERIKKILGEKKIVKKIKKEVEDYLKKRLILEKIKD